RARAPAAAVPRSAPDPAPGGDHGPGDRTARCDDEYVVSVSETHRFEAMGCEVVLGGASPSAALAVERLFRDRDRTFSRFIAGSELNRLNGSAGRPVRASQEYATMVRVALEAAADSDGLVDPTLGAALATRGGVGVALPHGGTVRLERGALATSGTDRRRWTRAGQLQHHLIDPRTGKSAHSPWQYVTACAATCVGADVAAKVGFLRAE